LDLDADNRKRFREVAGEHGLALSCVAAYNDFSSPIEEHRESEILMVREQIRLAADLGAPIVRVFAAWSGVTRRDGAITYEIARHNLGRRYPGVLSTEQWALVRGSLREVSHMAEDAGVLLALQNHSPVIENYRDVLDLIAEVDSPALKACLDAPLMKSHDEAYYREALRATGDLLVHMHFSGRFVQNADGTPELMRMTPLRNLPDYATFMRLAAEINGFSGHTGYELCSPVLIGHRHAGQTYALAQAALACEYMRSIIDSIENKKGVDRVVC